MENLDDIIKYLQNIQENLIGLILPVIITAIVSLITLIVNTTTKVLMENKKYNQEQYEIMKEFYPKLRTELIKVDFEYYQLKSNKLYKDIVSSIAKYVEYKKNPDEYRIEHKNEIDDIDFFINTMTKFLSHINDFYLSLNNVRFPGTPNFHPYLKIKVRKNIFTYGYFALIIYKYLNSKINSDLLIIELEKLNKNRKIKFNDKTLENISKIIDKWYFSF